MPQLTNLQFQGVTNNITMGGNFQQSIPNNATDFQLASTPVPLPIIGTLVALGFSRFYKKKFIK